MARRADSDSKAMSEVPSQPSSLLSMFRQGFQYEVFQDLQEYIYERFQRPTLALTRTDNGTLKPCFPRKRTPPADEFFQYLLEITKPSRKRTVIEEEEIQYSLEGIKAEAAGKPWKWGWRKSRIGLWDLYIPIRVQDSNGKRHVAGVLVTGKFRSHLSQDNKIVDDWISAITAGKRASDYFPKLSEVRRQEYAVRLRRLADNIPVLDKQTYDRMGKDLHEAVALLEVILTRTLETQSLFHGEEFLDNLGLGQPGVNISARQLWDAVGTALERIIQRLDLRSVALYSSNYSDYTDMRLIVSRPPGVVTAASLGLPSYEDFDWIQNQNWTTVPTDEDHLEWIDPHAYFGAESAILFGRAMIGGHLVLLGFGVGDSRLAATKRTALYEAVTSRLFRFIETSLFGIELDQLMAETGHLLGRAIGKVKSGVDTLNTTSFFLADDDPEAAELLRLAFWAMDDGVTRLELIRQNFYSFGNRRRTGKSQAEEPKEGEQREPVDIVLVLVNMKQFFDRAVEESQLKPIVFEKLCAEAPTLGREDDLKLVFLNLFDNAMKFAYVNTFIHISVSVQDGRCAVVFENLGVGVAPDEWERMFRRLTKSRYKDPSKRIEGLGLGLSYCRRVIEEIFGGKIQLRSREANTPYRRRFGGDNWLTSVTITIPLHDNQGDKGI